jgi:hypothetical protein
MADSSVSRFGCYTIIWDTTFATENNRHPPHRQSSRDALGAELDLRPNMVIPLVPAGKGRDGGPYGG